MAISFHNKSFQFATEKIHRADLDNLAVSLGQRCSSDKQCQLADSNTFCNDEQICECEAARNSAISTECSARNSGCAEGTFQVNQISHTKHNHSNPET